MSSEVAVLLFDKLSPEQKESVFQRWVSGVWDGNVAGARRDFRDATDPSVKIFCAMYNGKCYGAFLCREYGPLKKLLGQTITVSHPKELVRAKVDVAAVLLKGVMGYTKKNSLKFVPMLPTPEYLKMVRRIEGKKRITRPKRMRKK